MKMSNIEKVIICLIVLGVTAVVTGVNICVKEFNNAGGIKGICIEIGKDINDIGEQIEKEK